MRPDKFGRLQIVAFQQLIDMQETRPGSLIVLWRERTREGVAFYVFAGLYHEQNLVFYAKIARMQFRDQCLRRIVEAAQEMRKMGAGVILPLDEEVKRVNLLAAITRKV